ncbi:MAG: GIY-YIG nuclease family protein [Nitrospira sp.]|nr:GIY-YIG nuclease family protein [Nitrospira sp.]
MIYFIKNIVNGQIKIGYTDKPNKRLAELQTGSTDKLVLIRAIEGDKTAEAELHSRFAVHRLQGEWFAPVQDLLDFITGQTDKSLVGKFFHSFKDGKICWQGYIVADQADGYYLVQLFEWVLGDPSVQKVIHLGQMADWDFYGSTDEMYEAYERRTGCPSKPLFRSIKDAPDSKGA